MSKRPSFQFYPGDWRTDPGLRLCSVAARGLWAEMLCLMHEGDPYGHLTIMGRPITPQALARLVGEGVDAVNEWLDELRSNDVFSATEDGVIFSRRMVRDDEVREKRAAGGEAGKSFGHLGGEHGAKGGRPRKEKPPLGEEVSGVSKPAPSTSSSSPSSSPSSGEQGAGEGGRRDPLVPEPGAGLDVKLKAVCDRAGMVLDPSHKRWPIELQHLKGWLEKGYDIEADIFPAIDTVVLAMVEGDTVGALKLFDRQLSGRNAKKRVVKAKAEAEAPMPAQPIDFTKPGESAELSEWRVVAAATLGAGAYRVHLDGARLSVSEGVLMIAVGSPFAEAQLSSGPLFQLNALAPRLGCNFVRVVVEQQRQAA